MGAMGWQHWLLLAVIVLLLFGKGKVSDLMGDVAKGIKAFKKGMAEDDAPKPAPTEPAKNLEHQPTISSTTTPVSSPEQKSS